VSKVCPERYREQPLAQIQPPSEFLVIPLLGLPHDGVLFLLFGQSEGREQTRFGQRDRCDELLTIRTDPD
jgi:hypothetical protein